MGLSLTGSRELAETATYTGDKVITGDLSVGDDTTLDGDLVVKGGTANGQKISLLALTELLTIAAAANTDTTIEIPAGAIVVAVPVRVTTVIPTAANFDVGVAGTLERYAADLDVAVDTTSPGTLDGMRYYAAATKIRITPASSPGANTGRLRVTIIYFLVTPPTS